MSQDKIREILENLIYKKCCQTLSKNVFPPYERAINQALSQLSALHKTDKIDEGKLLDILRWCINDKGLYCKYCGFNDSRLRNAAKALIQRKSEWLG